jgi:hypothetical protein
MEWRDPARAARHRHKSSGLLTQEQRVVEVVKIVGKYRRDSVAGVVSTLIELQNEAADERTRKSKLHNKRLAKQLNTALRRITTVVNQLPLRNELLSHLDFFNGVSAALTHMALNEPVQPQPNAVAKTFAADAALVVCQACGIQPTITVRGKFLRIAAALYGDTRADLRHHCRAARGRAMRSSAKPQQK